MSVTEIENYRELILENIEYDCLKQRYPLYLDDLNEIVELLVETVCAKRKTTRISGADFPHEIVRSRFLKWIAPISSLSWTVCKRTPLRYATSSSTCSRCCSMRLPP